MAIIQAVGFTVGMGAGSITSRLLGKGWKERADQYASSAVILGLVLGLLLMSVCFVWIDELVWLLGATPTIYPYALDYAKYIIFGAPVMIHALQAWGHRFEPCCSHHLAPSHDYLAR